MEPKKFTQFGTFSVIALGSAMIFCLILMVLTGINDRFFIGIMGLVLMILLVCLLVFYKLTITIDNTSIRFSLGVGLIAKKYPISDIESCKPVKNNPLYGVGIRKIPKGWLYNVTGLEAVEIAFKSSGSIVRIGTNHSKEICEIISGLVTLDQSERGTEYKEKSGYIFGGIILAVALIFPLALIIPGNRDPGITIMKPGIKIGGMYGLTINYSDIQQIDTVSAIPRIKLKTNGYALGKSLKGNFRLQDNEDVKLFITKGVPPYILIRTDDHKIYLNFKKQQQTVDLFETLSTAGQ